MKRLLPLLAVALFSCTQAGQAGEIGYIEDFSLAADREAALKQLIPGTEEFYYFHCLYFQQTEQWAKVDQMLAAWIERYQHTARVIEIENRQALLTYDQNHQRALDLIRQRLNLQFNHQRELLNQNPNLPTALDPALIARERLAGIGFANYRNSVEGFEDAALDWLLTQELNPDQRRHLLVVQTRARHLGRDCQRAREHQVLDCVAEVAHLSRREAPERAPNILCDGCVRRSSHVRKSNTRPGHRIAQPRHSLSRTTVRSRLRGACARRD